MTVAAVFTILAGATLAKVRYYQPFLATGAAIATIASGLIYTLGIDFSIGKSVGYQLSVGIGDGIAVQIPVTAVLAFAPAADIPTVTVAVFCKYALLWMLVVIRYQQKLTRLSSVWQLCSGVVGIAAGQSIFSNRLLNSLLFHAPSVDQSQIL